MVKYRDAYVEAEKVLADSGTLTVPLEFTDIASQLEIHFKSVNGGTDNKSNTLISCISKIELVDGSDVLFSLSGKEAQALNYVNRGKVPARVVSEVAGDMQREVVFIDFGRYLGDPLWAFDPGRFTNPQLKFTWDLATNQAVGATGHLADSLRLSILARLFDEPVTPIGFFMSKEIFTYTSSGTATERVDMPIDHVYRTLLVRSYKANTWPGLVLQNFKLSEDNDKRIPFDYERYDLWHLMREISEAVYRILFKGQYGTILYFDVYAESAIQIATDLLANITVGHDLGWGGQVTLYMIDPSTGGAYGTDQRVVARVEGDFFHSCWHKRFGDPMNVEDWYDPTALGNLKLHIQSVVSDGDIAVVAQQARKY